MERSGSVFPTPFWPDWPHMCGRGSLSCDFSCWMLPLGHFSFLREFMACLLLQAQGFNTFLLQLPNTADFRALSCCAAPLNPAHPSEKSPFTQFAWNSS